MAWHPKTLGDALASGEVVETVRDPETNEVLVAGWPHKDHKTRGRIYGCSVCDQFRKPGLLVDIRHLPITGEFVCDNCWTDWERRAIPVDGNPSAPVDRKQWKRRWLLAHSAPQWVIDKVDGLRPVDPYGNQGG